jgi:hypothetical protein
MSSKNDIAVTAINYVRRTQLGRRAKFHAVNLGIASRYFIAKIVYLKNTPMQTQLTIA